VKQEMMRQDYWRIIFFSLCFIWYDPYAMSLFYVILLCFLLFVAAFRKYFIFLYGIMKNES